MTNLQKWSFFSQLRGSGKTNFRWVRQPQFRFWTVLTTYFSFWCCFLDGAISIPTFQALIDAPFGRISSICKDYQQNHTWKNRKFTMINFKISNIGYLVFQTKTTFQKCFLHFWVLGSPHNLQIAVWGNWILLFQILKLKFRQHLVG